MIPALVPAFMPTAAASGGLDPATTAWVSAVISHSGTVSAPRKTLVDTLITSLKTNSSWTVWDRIWVFAAENAPSALTDLKTGALATAHNGGALTFTVDRGYQDTTNPTSGSYIDSGFNPTTAPSPNYITDSGGLFGWWNSTASDTGVLVGLGATAVAGYSRIVPNNAGTMYWDLNSSDIVGSSSAVDQGATGLYLVNRRVGTGSQTLDITGTNVANFTVASTGPANANFLALAGGGGTIYSTSQICAFGFGAGSAGVVRQALNTALRTYMTAVGVP